MQQHQLFQSGQTVCTHIPIQTTFDSARGIFGNAGKVAIPQDVLFLRKKTCVSKCCLPLKQNFCGNIAKICKCVLPPSEVFYVVYCCLRVKVYGVLQNFLILLSPLQIVTPQGLVIPHTQPVFPLSPMHQSQIVAAVTPGVPQVNPAAAVVAGTAS